MTKSPFIWFSILLFTIAAVTALGPAEATLGTNVRVVYLHGAWVWTALCALFAAGLAGLIGLLFGQASLHRWGRALGRTGLFFWVTYLPISLWAMQANWNGLYLAEPRWRVAVIFTVAGLLLQLGLYFLPPSWASFWNLAYIATLVAALQLTDKVMHPPGPMLESLAWRIQLFFTGLTLLCMLAAWQVVRWFIQLETPSSAEA
jgi:hypothetical protein